MANKLFHNSLSVLAVSGFYFGNNVFPYSWLNRRVNYNNLSDTKFRFHGIAVNPQGKGLVTNSSQNNRKLVTIDWPNSIYSIRSLNP